MPTYTVTRYRARKVYESATFEVQANGPLEAASAAEEVASDDLEFRAYDQNPYEDQRDDISDPIEGGE